MYTYNISSDAQLQLSRIIKKSKDGVLNNIKELQENPLKKAKPNKKKNFGDYYINAGNQYSILFDINNDKKRIEIHAIVRQGLLYRLLN